MKTKQNYRKETTVDSQRKLKRLHFCYLFGVHFRKLQPTILYCSWAITNESSSFSYLTLHIPLVTSGYHLNFIINFCILICCLLVTTKLMDSSFCINNIACYLPVATRLPVANLLLHHSCPIFPQLFEYIHLLNF